MKVWHLRLVVTAMFLALAIAWAATGHFTLAAISAAAACLHSGLLLRDRIRSR